MKTRYNVVDGIRSSLEHKNRATLVEKYIANGCTLTEIVEAFSGTKWKFYLKNCGLRIEIINNDDLRADLEQALASLSSTASKLLAHEMFGPPSHEVMAQIRVGTEVARAAVGVKSAEARSNLFFPQEHKPKGKSGDPISECLKPLGFEWAGDDIVSEIWTKGAERVRENMQSGSPIFPLNSNKNSSVH